MIAAAHALGENLIAIYNALRTGIGKAHVSALNVVQAWQDAAPTFRLLGDVMGVLKDLRDFLKVPITLTAEMTAQAQLLGANLVALFNALRLGIGKVKPSALNVVQAWQDVSGTFSMLTDTMSFLRSLRDWLKDPVTLVGSMTAQAQILATDLTLLFYAMRDGIGKAKPAGLAAVQAWADASGLFSALTDTMGFLVDMRDWLKAPVTLTNQMTSEAGRLATDLTLLFYAMRDGIGKAKPAGLAAVQAWADASRLFSTLTDTMGFLVDLRDWLKAPVALTGAMLSQVTALAADLTLIFYAMRDGIGKAKPAGLAAIQAWQDASGLFSTLTDTMGFLRDLADWLKTPVALTGGMLSQVTTLAADLVLIFYAMRDGIGKAKPAGLAALQAWQDVGNLFGMLTDTMGFLADMRDFLKEPVVLTSQMLAQATTLAADLVLLFYAIRDGIGKAKPAGLVAVQAWQEVSGIFSTLTDTMGFLADLRDWTAKPIALTQEMISQAYVLSDNLVRLFTAFYFGLGYMARTHPPTDAVQSAVSAWSSVFGDMMSAFESGFKIKELVAFLTTFTGFNFTVLGPKLNLLIDGLVEIFNRFALRAQSANLTEAAQKAVAAFSTGAGQAIDTLSKGLDFAQKIVDSVNLRLPAGPQIDALLAPIFALIDNVAAAFTAHAASVDQDRLDEVVAYANGVKAFFETIQTAIEATQAAAGLHVESSGFNNINRLLQLLFGMFDNFAVSADTVNSVTAALSSMLGGIENMVAANGTTSGQSWVASFVAAINAGAGSIQAAIAAATGPGAANGTGSGPGGTIRATPPGGGTGGTTINNTYNNFTKNFSISVTNTDAGAASATAAGLTQLVLY